MASKFSAEIFQLYCDTFPVKKVNCKSNCKPWINKKMLCLINERDRLFKEGFFQESRKLRNIVISEIRKVRKEHGAHVLNKLLYSNIKNFNKCIQDFMGKVSSKFLLLDSNGDPVSADIINDYFRSTCKTHPAPHNIPANSAVSEIPVIEIHQTQLTLENLDTNKSVYPGDISTKLIVKYAHYLSVPLTAIFNQCFVDDIFPVCFKRAIISPILKIKTPKVLSDLRPISKTSIFSKIFESFICNFLFDDNQDKIDPNQFGFRPNHSTTHCLCYILDTVFKHLELNSSYAEAVFSD